MKFSTDLLKCILNDEDHPDFDKIETVSDKQTDKSRWCDIHTWIFKYEGKFYRTTYRTGSTESQDERPFEYDGPEVEAEEVFPTEVTITKYFNAKQLELRNAKTA